MSTITIIAIFMFIFISARFIYGAYLNAKLSEHINKMIIQFDKEELYNDKNADMLDFIIDVYNDSRNPFLYIKTVLNLSYEYFSNNKEYRNKIKLGETIEKSLNENNKDLHEVIELSFKMTKAFSIIPSFIIDIVFVTFALIYMAMRNVYIALSNSSVATYTNISIEIVKKMVEDFLIGQERRVYKAM